MRAYIRFESSRRCAHFKRPLGVFRAAGTVEEQSDLPGPTLELLRDSLRWFNCNLKVPRQSSVSRRGVFWFRSSAHDVVDRMWELVAILRDEGVHVDLRHTNRPGQIVYEDDQQVAAIPGRR
jgi:hypothetical protein